MYTLLVQLFILALFIDIGGKFGIKYLVFVVVLMVSIMLLAKGSRYKSMSIDVYFAFFIFLYSILGFILGARLDSIYSQVGFIMYFFLMPVLTKSNTRKVFSFFENASFYAAVVIIFIFVGLYLFPELNWTLNKFSIEYGIGYLGLKSDLGNIPNVYFRWTAWLLLGFSISLYCDHLLKSLVIFIASLLTLSTAIISATLVIYFIYLKNTKKIANYRMVIVILAILISMYFYPLLFENFISKFSSDSFSTSVKIGHIISAINEWLSNGSSFLFGMGVGTEFFTMGTNSNTVAIEPSYANLLRQFGIIGSTVFLLYISHVFLMIKSQDRLVQGVKYGIIGILFVGATNPIFFSVLLFFPLLILKSHLLKTRG
jgi:hypothetical protein